MNLNFIIVFFCFFIILKANAGPKVDGSEKLNPNVQSHLFEEQVLHAKDLWGDLFSQGNTISAAYYPEARPKFRLAYYLVPESAAELLSTAGLHPDVAKQIIVNINGARYFKMFVHPESVEYFKFLLKNGAKFVSSAQTEFWASPTSSFRSLVVWNENNPKARPFIAKVSLDKIVDGNDRLVSTSEIRRSIANQNTFEQIGRSRLNQIGLDIFPETAGVAIKENLVESPTKLGGQLIREIPDTILNGERRWISLAALMSRHRDRLMIADSMRATHMNAVNYIETYIVDNYMRSFEELSFEYGINYEPHSQNLLMEFDNSLRPTGKFIIRDFGGVWPDALQMATRHPELLRNYMKEGNANLFRFERARENYFSSYVFYYKAHFTDKLFPEILNREHTINSADIVRFNRRMDQQFIQLVQHYLDPSLTQSPSMENYKSLAERARTNSKLPGRINTGLDGEAAQSFLINKNALGEEVSFSSSPKAQPAKYFGSNEGVFKVEDGKVTKYAIFTESERNHYLASPANLLNNHDKIRKLNCLAKGASVLEY